MKRIDQGEEREEQGGNTDSGSSENGNKSWGKESHEQWKGRWRHRKSEKHHSSFGLVLIFVGAWWLLKKMGLPEIPHWVFTWPALLVGMGLISLIYHRFQSAGAYIAILIGSFFLARNAFDIPLEIQKYFWPVLVIFIGLIILFKPKKRWYKNSEKYRREWERAADYCGPDGGDFSKSTVEDADTIKSTVTLSGSRKDVVTKAFKGGSIEVILAGAELDFSNADIADSRATLHVNVILGGMKIIVPQNWIVLVNTDNIMGGVEDKRRNTDRVADKKTLEITGTVLMGGLEIRSV